MNKTNKVRKGEVRIYGGKTYVAIPEIKEDHCAGCCFYNEGCCSIRDFDHIDFPDCHNSGMIWMQKEINMSDIKEKAILFRTPTTPLTLLYNYAEDSSPRIFPPYSKRLPRHEIHSYIHQIPFFLFSLLNIPCKIRRSYTRS